MRKKSYKMRMKPIQKKIKIETNNELIKKKKIHNKSLSAYTIQEYRYKKYSLFVIML